MALRDYQAEDVDAVFRDWARHRSTLLVQATGLGKTHCAAEVIRRAGGTSMFVAHTDELINQAAEKLRDYEVPTVIDKAAIRPDWQPEHKRGVCIVTSNQTAYRPDRHNALVMTMQKHGIPNLKGIIIDEAHHAPNKTYMDILDRWPLAKVLGLTATPKRQDKVAMGLVFESVASTRSIEWGISNGWLVEPRPRTIVIKGLVFPPPRDVKGDYSDEQAAAIMMQEKPMHGVCKATLDVAKHLHTKIFCAGIVHAEATAGVMSRYLKAEGMDLGCYAVHGKTKRDLRRQLVEQFRNGESILTSCNALLEGFDAPAMQCLVLNRPTVCLIRLTQIVGRITRPNCGVDSCADAGERIAAINASNKPWGLVIDFAGSCDSHDICRVTDILGGNYTPQVREHARSNASAEGGEYDPKDSLERAKAELDFIHMVRAKRESIMAKQVEYTEHHSSLFRKQAPRQNGKQLKFRKGNYVRWNNNEWEVQHRMNSKFGGQPVLKLKSLAGGIEKWIDEARCTAM